MLPIYLDNAATTQPLPSLQELYDQYAESLWYNPSALYRDAGGVRVRMEEVRRALLEAFGSSKHHCLFTSGGTEGANMVIRAGVSRRRNGNYVCAGFEHPCVEEAFKTLAGQGAEVRFVPVDSGGRTELEALLARVDENTLLVSCMHVNNETGAVNDVGEIARAVKQRSPRTLVHADGVQAFLRVPLRNASLIDYYTISAHKLHALKGTGALFYNPEAPLKALLSGGGQEGGLRSGTENTLGILALGAAVDYFREHGREIAGRHEALHGRLIKGLKKIPGARILTPDESCRHIVSVSFPGLRGETLLHMLEEENIVISTGSACSSHKGRSRAERALGLSKETARGAVRISLGAWNTEPEIERLLAALEAKSAQLARAVGVQL